MGSSGVSWRAVKGAVRTAGRAARRVKSERMVQVSKYSERSWVLLQRHLGSTAFEEGLFIPSYLSLTYIFAPARSTI